MFLPLYYVNVDTVSGAWITEPCLIGLVNYEQWTTLSDSKDCHFDTYEIPLTDTTSETRAIICFFV